VKVVVTGGNGFIGRATCAALAEAGHVPLMFDRSVGQDVLDGRQVAELVGEARAVIHLAGVLGTAELFDNPMEALAVNAGGTMNVLSACAQSGARFVGISMPESGWANVYAATKACSRMLASAWHRHYGVPTAHVTAYNAFGPGQHVGSPQKISPTFADRAWRGLPIPVWGSGEQTVDLVHTDDIARMLVAALAFGDDDTFDAGTGRAVTVNQVAEFVLAVTGSDAGIEYLPMRLGEDADTNIVAKGAGWERLGWRPEFSWERLVQVVAAYRPARVAA
jgi:UDP-glucose 4-epimerase